MWLRRRCPASAPKYSRCMHTPSSTASPLAWPPETAPGLQTLAASLDGCVRADDPYFNKLIRIMATRCMTQAVYLSSGAGQPRGCRWAGGCAAPRCAVLPCLCCLELCCLQLQCTNCVSVKQRVGWSGGPCWETCWQPSGWLHTRFHSLKALGSVPALPQARRLSPSTSIMAWPPHCTRTSPPPSAGEPRGARA